MQPHPEHQQHHTELGQLVGDGLVGNEAWCERPHTYAGQQIADQGESFAFCASVPRMKATARPTAMMSMRLVS